MNIFGERLKSLRDKNKQSINELVVDLNKKYETNISKSMISRYENGQSDPKMEVVRILADYFNVSSDYLVGISDMEIKPLQSKNQGNIETIAAHHDDEDWTEEELEEIRRFKEFVKSKRKNNQE
ncbi:MULTISPECIES: helix-turn-helix domain-containing protein [Bacillus]|uniref:helix-turn-helix domain-containing protein n=1 Tax=Bacillus TaxID=1386 RepID=UPI0013202ECD|nr:MULTISPECIES: helix-turn-helix transcriptional regulator [Bacillus]KAF1681247.1 transcriptional regulator [Bacillus sp. SKDU12]MCY7783709.1 helix-turn-helix domain-containing protein [Bacillus sp. S20C3]MCY8287830.1 helix-turn-helix domain-containing protein [Bacillus sp. N13C7]MCY8639939.1 helix-turn-helix domain-containing protein [Bacillus sp. S17B2]MCY8718413.1 helix-turn-helix domain-containing protein [Bacillus sp. S10C12M]MCY9142969.1 helix-turn-helix domain-containing protein [Baci